MKYAFICLFFSIASGLSAQEEGAPPVLADSIVVTTSDSIEEPGIDTLINTSEIQSLVNQGIDAYTAFVEGGSEDETKVEEAISLFKQALAQNANHYEGNENLARVYENESGRLMTYSNENRANLSGGEQKDIEKKIYEYMTLAEEHAAKAKK